MNEIRTVIKSLGRCASDRCEGCPYFQETDFLKGFLENRRCNQKEFYSDIIRYLKEYDHISTALGKRKEINDTQGTE